MSAGVKLILAMTLGAVGLILAILATVVALNAKNAADSDQATSAEIRQEVSEELDTRARQQKRGLNRVERFVNQLSKQEEGSLGSLKTVKRRVNRLSREVKAIESDQRAEYAELDRRIGATNRNVANLRQQVQRLRNRLEVVEATSGP